MMGGAARWTKSKLSKADRLVKSTQRTELDPYERSMLIPFLRSQLQVLHKSFTAIKRIAENAKTREDLEGPLSQVLRVPYDAARYLGDVARVVQTDFLDTLEARLTESQADFKDIGGLAEWLSRVRMIASSIHRNRSVLFVDELRSFAYVKNNITGTSTTLPANLTVITYPFDTWVRECAEISDSMEISIAHWFNTLATDAQQLRQLLIAREGARAQLYALLFQLALVVFTVIFTFALFLAAAPYQDWWAAKRARGAQSSAALSPTDTGALAVPTVPDAGS
jgi:hypothetical protein